MTSKIREAEELSIEPGESKGGDCDTEVVEAEEDSGNEEDPPDGPDGVADSACGASGPFEESPVSGITIPRGHARGDR